MKADINDNKLTGKEETAFELAPPRGMRDFYPEDMLLRNKIFEAWHKAARVFGFFQYDACVVESLNLLKRKSGEEIVEQIYAFQDKSGRELALRPEMTPTLARMVAARFGSLQFPLRWYAIAQCFRYERMSKGRKREHYQWNLDIIGENNVSAEAEVVTCALSAIEELGLKKDAVKVHFNSRALLGELLLKCGIPSDQHSTVFLALDKRGKISDDEIKKMLSDSGLSTEQREKTFGLLSINTIAEAEALLKAPSKAIEEIKLFIKLMNEYGYSDDVMFDISVVRGLGYYTGIVFEAFDKNKQFRAIFGGGRYNNLLQVVGGKSIPAVGLGFGDVVISELMSTLLPEEKPKLKVDYAIGYMSMEEQHFAIKVANFFRKGGASVELWTSPEKPKNFFAKVGRGIAEKAIFIGPDETQKNEVRIKNLFTREEQVVKIL